MKPSRLFFLFLAVFALGCDDSSSNESADQVSDLQSDIGDFSMPDTADFSDDGDADLSEDDGDADLIEDDGDAELSEIDAPPSCEGCFIDGICQPEGAVNGANLCQVCHSALDDAAWSPHSGLPCDDGAFCTVNDRCEAGSCVGEPRDCSDGIACTGAEQCDESTDSCLAGESTCPENSFCNGVTDECVASCSGCLIEQVCYGDQQANPLNPCERCLAANALDQWSQVQDGTLCDDGEFCNGSDSCLGGACSAHADEACPDDGFFCTGTEYCDESVDRCQHTGWPCGDGESCEEAIAMCCVPNVAATDFICDANGDLTVYDSCGYVLERQLCGTNQGSCIDDACECLPGWGGELCDCRLFVDGEVAASGDGSTWDTAFKTIQEAIDATDGGCGIWVKGLEDGLTYNEHLEVSGGVRLYGGFWGGEMEYSEHELGRCLTLIDGQGSGTMVTFLGDMGSTQQAVLDGFTIHHGNRGVQVDGGHMLISDCRVTENSQSAGESGAGLYVADGDIVIERSLFSNNLAGAGANGVSGTYSPTAGEPGGNGGGAYFAAGRARLSTCRFEANRAGNGGVGGSPSGGGGAPGGVGGDGGALVFLGEAINLVDCAFSQNYAGHGGMGGDSSTSGQGAPGAGGKGGGLYLAGEATLVNTLLRENRAGKGASGRIGTNIGVAGGAGGSGGALYAVGLATALINIEMQANAAGAGGNGGRGSFSAGPGGAGGDGGGARIVGGEAFVVGGLIIDNTAGNGGVGRASTFEHNPDREGGRGGHGGGIYATAELQLTSTTLSENHAGSGGAGGGDAEDGADGIGAALGYSQTAEISNSIVWENHASSGLQLEGSGELTVISSDLQGGCSTLVGANCMMEAAGGTVIDSDPLFIDPSAQVYYLGEGSPALDSADASLLPADDYDLDQDGDTTELLPLELDGHDRIYDGVLDMGAYERWTGCGNFIVDGTEDCDDGNSNAGDGCNELCSCEPGVISQCALLSCQEAVAYAGELSDGPVWIGPPGEPEAATQLYCDLSTAGGGWTLIARFNSNDGTIQDWDSEFWTSTEEIGSIFDDLDYLSPLYTTADDWSEILFDYRYSTDQSKRMAATFAGTSGSTLSEHCNLARDNSNPAWPRVETFSTGVDADAANWYGPELRFQILGNGNDGFRMWYNQVAVDACNQAGGIGGMGDNNIWRHELSFPSASPGCQENDIRGRIGSNGGGSFMNEVLLTPTDAYDEGIMWVLVR